VFSVGVTSWKWLKKLELRVVVQNVILFMTKRKRKKDCVDGKKLKGCYSNCAVSCLFFSIIR